MSKPVVSLNSITRKLNIHQLSALHFDQWQKGNMSDDLIEFVQEGLIPLHLIRQEIGWILEKTADGNIMLTTAANDDKEAADLAA